MNYRIFPPDGLPECSINLPLSKSMSARALIINALQLHPAERLEVAQCADTEAMLRGLASRSGDVNIDNAGTAMRFLTAYYAITQGSDVLLDGGERMRQRPIGPLVEALRACGADIQYAGNEGFPPLAIKGRALAGGEVSIDATVSSQFISALMMIAPYMDNGLTIRLIGEPASRPYILMTAAMMEIAGASVEITPDGIVVAPTQYSRPIESVEPDWSAAGFWYEIEALTSGFITLAGLRGDSVQGDRATADIFRDLSVETEFTEEGAELCASPELSPRLQLDLDGTPDLVPALVVTCVMMRLPFRFAGLDALPIKECNRIEALMNEMLKLGAVLELEGRGIMSWDGVLRPVRELPRFATYEDHRMAMALAPIAAYLPGIVVCDIEAVGKSYPSFWEDMRQAGFIVQDENDPIPSQFTDEQ